MIVTEGPRVRELHRYYQPWLEAFHGPKQAQQIPPRSDGHRPQSSKDKALTAFAQLGALRLGVKRGIVTLIDSKNQYILAEATRSMSLLDDDRHLPGDELWLGNAVLPRAQGVSPDALDPPTYHAKGPGDDMFQAPALVVDDISHDDRYKDRAYAGPNGINFYAGVPLISKRGHRIGVYSVSHDEPRNGLTGEELRTLTDMATVCMRHLETIKNERARARGERLITGIGTFIEGRGSEALLETPSSVPASDLPPVEQTTKLPERPHLPQDGQPGSDFKGMTISDMNQAGRDQYSQDGSRTSSIEEGIDSKQISADGSDASSTHQQRPAPPMGPKKPASDTKLQYISVFERASKILRKCMVADGVAFVDASAANLSKGTSRQVQDKSLSSHLSHERYSGTRQTGTDSNGIPSAAIDASGSDQDVQASSSDNQGSGGESSDRGQDAQQFCDNISTSITDRFRPIDIRFTEHNLRRIIRRYPQGKVYQFDSQGRVVTSDEGSETANYTDESTQTAVPKRRRLPRSKNPLLDSVPDARTIIVLPLYDMAKSRWHSAAIIWSCNSSKLMNVEEDLSYLRSFGNAIMHEVARLNLAVSDTAKATFLANISHELRSPLHGILGSIEFLHDSALDDFQSNMVISVETCGKTLLDTVEHVLDHSKLNSLGNSHHKRRDGITQATTSDSSLLAKFDLAVTVEEGVDAVYQGQVFRTANAEALEGKGTSESASQKVMKHRADRKARIAQGQHEYSTAVRLTLNIDDATSWEVVSQPGAIRRIVMNLLGNALKYTSSGTIDVSLEVDHSRDYEDDGHLHTCLTVTDTGKGMSDDFVRNHAFTAFSQEDSLTSGTGLGLSIIRQICDSLGGKINLRSQKDVGTEIKIWLSFPREPRNGESLPSHSSMEKDILHEMQKCTDGMKLCMLTPDVVRSHLAGPEHSLRPMPSVEDSMQKVLTDWFGMEVSVKNSMNDVKEVDFFMYAEPPPIEYLLDSHGEQDGLVPVILLCQNHFQASSLRANGLHTLVELGRIIEIIAQPVGPQKMAKETGRISPNKYNKPQRPSPTPVAPHSDHDSAHSRVLVVDDNAINLQLLETMMRKSKHPYESATDGQKAFDAYKKSVQDDNAFIHILMDISMPIMDGITATKEIRKFEKEKKVKNPVKIIALTGMGDGSNAKAQAQETGFDHFLSKPVKFKDLSEMLV